MTKINNNPALVLVNKDIIFSCLKKHNNLNYMFKFFCIVSRVPRPVGRPAETPQTHDHAFQDYLLYRKVFLRVW